MLAMFTKTSLPNGLRVVTHPMTGAKSVAVMVMLGVTSGPSLHPMHYWFIAAAFFFVVDQGFAMGVRLIFGLGQ